MSTPALTVQQPRHLSLPEACLVTPSQLSIPQSISKEQFLAVAAKLKALGQAEDFWLADAAHFAKKWDDGLQLMAETVGRTKYHLVRVAQIAERFTPAKRFSYTVAHLRALMPFPDEFLDRFLPSAASLNLSVKALRSRAEAEYGENPYKPKQPKKRSVPLRASLVAQLSELAPKRVSVLIERICEDWLSKPEQQAIILAIAELQPKKPKAEKIKEPADIKFQLDKYYKQQAAARRAEKSAEGIAERDGNDIPSAQPHPETSTATETPRPTYEDRRKQQIDAAAEKIPQKRCKTKIVFTICRALLRPDKFFSLQGATDAAARYSADRGYTVFPGECERCSEAPSAGKRKVWHVFRERPMIA
jgi:hypothetical protein